MKNNKSETDLHDLKNQVIGSHAMIMLKLISQGEDDIKNGRVVSQDKVFSELEKWVYLN